MAGRPLSAAQLQHNRDIAKKGGQATAAKYGGYHFAHAARSARARGTYSPPPIRAPFASLRAKPASRGLGINLNIIKKISSLSPPRSVLPPSMAGRTTQRSRRRRPAVR